jgi:hypothetical protein
MTVEKPAVARDYKAEMAAVTAAASRYTQAQADAQAASYRQMLADGLAATDSLAGRLNNGYTAEGLAALRGAAGQAAGMDALSGRLEGLGAVAEGDVRGTEIEALLRRQALEELALGRSMSLEQEREATQGARAGYAARGMAMGGPSLAAEILSRDRAGNARLAERRAFAGAVNQAETQNRIARLGAAGSLLGQAAGNRANTAQLGLSAARGFVELDPYQRALGSNLPTAALGASASMAGNTFQNVMGYGQDLFNTNFNAGWSDYLNERNALQADRMGRMQAKASRAAGNSSMMGAGIGAAGAIVGGAIAF